MAKILSSPLIVGAATTAGRCGAGVAGRCCEMGAAAVLVGAGAAAGAAAVFGANDGAGVALGAPVGPPGGSVGSLMVGAAEGLGGKLMRTVSFLGCTLPVSFFGGGTAPVGGLGGRFSAIALLGQDKRLTESVKFKSEK